MINRIVLSPAEMDFFMAADLSPAEKQLFAIVLKANPDEILHFAPRTYRTKNSKTGRIVDYFACSKDRALALAYMDQGWHHQIDILLDTEPKDS